MRILFLNQFFYPDLAATAQLAGDLASDLARAGHSVSVIASRGSYLGGMEGPRRETWNGVSILRVWSSSFGKSGLLGRLCDYASFYLSAGIALLFSPRQDVIVALTTPPFIGTVAIPVQVLRGTRLCCWVQDVYPDVAFAAGLLSRNSLFGRVSDWLGGFLLGRADVVIALGERMAQRCVQAGARAEHVCVVPNWGDDGVLVDSGLSASEYRRDLVGGFQILVMYSGNMGVAHDMALIVEALRAMREKTRIRWVFQGDGAWRSHVEVACRDLPNAEVRPYVAKERLAGALQAADIHLISLRHDMEGLVEPSKLYGIMASGRPVVYIGPGGSEVARTIREERIGLVLESKDPSEIANAIEGLCNSPELRREMGHRARCAFETRYRRSRRVPEILDALERSLRSVGS